MYTFIKDEDTGLYVCSAYNDDRNMPIMNFIFAEDVETIVTFDGVKYKLKPSVKIEDKDGDFTANDVYAMGNLNLLGVGEYTGEPFIIHGTKMDGTYVATDVFGFEHTIKVDKIIGTEIKQIPKEFVEKDSKVGYVVTIIILVLIILGLSGFIVYEHYTTKQKK